MRAREQLSQKEAPVSREDEILVGGVWGGGGERPRALVVVVRPIEMKPLKDGSGLGARASDLHLASI